MNECTLSFPFFLFISLQIYSLQWTQKGARTKKKSIGDSLIEEKKNQQQKLINQKKYE